MSVKEGQLSEATKTIETHVTGFFYNIYADSE